MTGSTEQLFGGSWTEKKLQILSKYLSGYNTALKNQPFKRVYIDAFAGTGYRQQRKAEYDIPDLFEEFSPSESENFMKGSATLALETRPSFDEYFFIESDQKKVDELDKLKRTYPSKEGKMVVIQSDANTFIQDYCKKEDWNNTRAVLFLDPFATEVSWETIKIVAKTKCIDVWILFPLMAVNRLLAKDHEKVFNNCLNRVFGTDNWFECFYETRTLEDIFGKPLEIVNKKCNYESIGEFYKQRLKTVFAGVAEKPKIFYNSCGSPLFQFYFAAGNPRGSSIAVRIADHLLKNI